MLAQGFRRRYLMTRHFTPWVACARTRIRKRVIKQSALDWRSSTLRLEGLKVWRRSSVSESFKKRE